MPVDPGRHWLEAGITGLARQREWDAVVTVEAAGEAGEEVELVVLVDGRTLVESGPERFDPAPLVRVLAQTIRPPYRAVARRRDELWAVGARAIETVELHPSPRGDDLQLTWDGATMQLAVDGLPADPSAAPALERLASGREHGPFAAHAHRLADDLWEVLVLPL